METALHFLTKLFFISFTGPTGEETGLFDNDLVYSSVSERQQYDCEYCGKMLSNPTALKRHLQRHTGDDQVNSTVRERKRYDCEYCGKVLSNATALKRHLRLHTGEKPYSCELCSKLFLTNGNLQSHLRRHHKLGQLDQTWVYRVLK